MKQPNIDAAKAILAQQDPSRPLKWGAQEHCAMLANIALAAFQSEQGLILPDEQKDLKRALRSAFADDGVAGNASQFRQGLAKLGLVPEAANAALATYE